MNIYPGKDSDFKWHIVRSPHNPEVRRFKSPPRNTCCVDKIDANPKIPDAVRLLGFFIPIFHSANLVDAKRQKRRVDGI